MGLIEAMQYVPTNPTYAIRIESDRLRWGADLPLRESGLYTIITYAFDDITPQWGEGKLFDEEMARRILADFKERALDQATLLVHCARGKNRSPAVGIALSEVFRLGQDTNKLKKEYPEANWFIYDILIEAARRL